MGRLGAERAEERFAIRFVVPASAGSCRNGRLKAELRTLFRHEKKRNKNGEAMDQGGGGAGAQLEGCACQDSAR